MEKKDFIDWQRDMQDSLEGAGFTKDDYREVVRKLHVLLFHIDRKGKNIVSHINDMITFVDRGYVGERILEGDVWLCSEEFHNVYCATSFKKITSSMIMGVLATTPRAHRRLAANIEPPGVSEGLC